MSVDMQKVIMLPRLPGVKTCVFTWRLVAFHETFAPRGTASSIEKKDQLYPYFGKKPFLAEMLKIWPVLSSK